jgi:hypothetical protein
MDRSASHLPFQATVSPYLRLTGRILATAWAAFWTWFCVNVAVAEGGHSIFYAGAIVGGAWAMAALAWCKPRLGGAALMIAGLTALWLFPGAWAVLLMASPPIAAGAMLIGSSRRPAASLTPA